MSPNRTYLSDAAEAEWGPIAVPTRVAESQA